MAEGLPNPEGPAVCAGVSGQVREADLPHLPRWPHGSFQVSQGFSAYSLWHVLGAGDAAGTD